MVLVQQIALGPLKEIENFDAFAKMMLIPHDCNDDGCQSVHPVDMGFLSQFDSSGGHIFVSGPGGELKADFLASR